MALSGNEQAYLQARAGIARSGAIRSNYVFPLFGVITVGGVDVSAAIKHGSLSISLALNEQPDTCTFSVHLTTPEQAAALVVGAEVVIGLGGPSDNPLFGGRILTVQTTFNAGGVPELRSVLCADYLQGLDAEELITYAWPAQSTTLTIHDLFARFSNQPGGVPVDGGSAVLPGLPSHAAIAVSNERFSTVLRRLVTMFPGGGGFYVDPLKVLHVWEGPSEPNMVNPRALTRDNPRLKGFAFSEDGSQIRDVATVEGRRTSAPIGVLGPDPSDPTGRLLPSVPVLDASILDPLDDPGVPREVRIGTQRLLFAGAEGIWSAPEGTPQTTEVSADVAFDPEAPGPATIPITSLELFTGRTAPWLRIDEQYLRAVGWTGSPISVDVPRTGYGAMTGPIKAGAVATVIDALVGGSVTGRYDRAADALEVIRPQPIEADVILVVRTTTGLGIHEQIIQDGRFSRAGAAARGVREITDFDTPIPSLEFVSDDLNAKPGRLQVYDLASARPGLPARTGQMMILSADLTWPVWGQPPRRTCHAADVHPADIVDTWLVDRR